MVIRAYIMWRLFKLDVRYLEFLWLAYKQDLAEYHLRKVNDYILVNPYFQEFKKVGLAEGTVHFKKGRKELIVEPAGILSFKRGRHPDIVICDDILKDPENQLNISQVLKITEVFHNEVASLPKEGGELHVFGTPQDERDVFYDVEHDQSFDAREYPAMNEATRKVLWPQGFSYERLIEILNSIQRRAFNREYMCKPSRSTRSYVDADNLGKRINRNLINHDHRIFRQTENDVYAGFDIGKVIHPSHLAVFEKIGNKLIQIHSKWFDHVDYIDQIDYLKEVIKNFKVNELVYDNTRGEFTIYEEEGRLPAEMTAVSLSSKMRFSAASALQSAVNRGEVELLDDDRQTRQILNCDEDLQSVETKDGHGDSFWSVGLGIKAANLPQPNILIL